MRPRTERESGDGAGRRRRRSRSRRRGGRARETAGSGERGGAGLDLEAESSTTSESPDTLDRVAADSRDGAFEDRGEEEPEELELLADADDLAETLAPLDREVPEVEEAAVIESGR